MLNNHIWPTFPDFFSLSFLYFIPTNIFSMTPTPTLETRNIFPCSPPPPYFFSTPPPLLPSRHNYVESTLNPRHGLTLFPRWYLVLFENWINVWFSTLIPRHVFHFDSTCFPRWIHVFSTLNQRDVFNVESTWCFQRGFHVDIWFYMKVDSMSRFQRWIYVMFSTLNPHNIFN